MLCLPHSVKHGILCQDVYTRVYTKNRLVRLASPNKKYTLSRKDRSFIVVHWQVREMIRYHGFLNDMSLAAATFDLIRSGFKARGYFKDSDEKDSWAV